MSQLVQKIEVTDLKKKHNQYNRENFHRNWDIFTHLEILLVKFTNIKIEKLT